MTITVADPLGTQAQPIVWLDWEQYLAWLGGKLTRVRASWGEVVKLGPPWQPGEHMALDGPTGEGKTTHAVGVLSLRKYVLALDPKGEDKTLSESGYMRVTSIYQDNLQYRLTHREDAKTWDHVFKAIEGGRPARVIVGQGSRTLAEDVKNQVLMGEGIAFCRRCGGFTMYVDEFELLSSPRMFKQGPAVERMLISARSAGTSVVTTFQAPAWISQHATRQSRRAVKWPTGDRNMIKKLAEGMGRDWRDLGAIVDELPPFHTVTIPRGKHHPMIITSAPKLR